MDHLLAPGEEDDLFTSSSHQKQKQTSLSIDATPSALFFLVWWVDPKHRLSHLTQSQAVPAWWCTLMQHISNLQCLYRMKKISGLNKRWVMSWKMPLVLFPRYVFALGTHISRTTFRIDWLCLLMQLHTQRQTKHQRNRVSRMSSVCYRQAAMSIS